MGNRVHCSFCGAPLDTMAVRCSYCGIEVEGVSTLQQQEARIKEIQSAIKGRNSTFSEAMELARLFMAVGKNAHAEDCLRRAIELEPNAPHPRLLLCLSLLGFNRQAASSRVYEDEIMKQYAWLHEHHRDLPEVEWLGYFLELERLMWGGDWRRGIEKGAAAVEKYPDNYLLQFMYGLALMHFGDTKNLKPEDYRKALHYFKLSAELNPEFVPAVKNASALEDYLKG